MILKKTNLNCRVTFAYTIEEGNNDKNYWHKIGAAWPTREGGLSLQLTAIPIDGKVALRSREELERIRAERQEAPKQHPTKDRGMDSGQ